MLPVSSMPGNKTQYIDALFTATSATCVTGLITVLTSTHWTTTGKVIILLLIQIGGLGIMTASALFALLLGKKFSLKERLLMQEALGQFSLAGLVRLTKYILIITFLVEGTGAFLLFLRFISDMPVAQAAWFGVFHSISAFCNAGFDLFGNSFESYVQDWPVNLIITSLIILGGIGFVVIVETWQARGQWHNLSLHSKLAIITTVVLIVSGTLLIYLFEHDNPATLLHLRPDGKWLASYFHSVTPRTAGFNTLPTGRMLQPSLLLTIVLMFIGASPGGTGGGIKTTTFALILFTVHSIIRGQEPTVGRRSIGHDLVGKSLAIAFLALALLTTVTLLLTVTEKHDFLSLLFEATSAFGTVGLSMGITSELTSWGKAGLILLMFAGRLGPLTLAMALTQQKPKAKVHYPEAKIMVG